MCYSEAKALFFQYGGRHSAMANDGRLEAYRAFRVPMETENRWRAEIEEQLIGTLARDPHPEGVFQQLCGSAQRSGSSRAITALYRFLTGEGFAAASARDRLYMIESFLDTLRIAGQTALPPDVCNGLTALLRRAGQTEDPTLRRRAERLTAVAASFDRRSSSES